MITTSNIILLLTALTTALMAGLFYSWSISVIPGIAKLSDPAYIGAMQAMNRAILNPAFFAGFMGTVILLPTSVYMHYSQSLPLRFWFLLVAALFYIIGVFCVTMFGNVPLNEALESFDLHNASSSEITYQRIKFEQPWNRLNSFRTASAIFAIIFVITACLFPNKD